MISCAEHDYIEIACLYRIPVRLNLISGDSLEGTPLDTGRNRQGEEYLLLDTERGEIPVVLARIKRMQARIANPHFDSVLFGESA